MKGAGTFRNSVSASALRVVDLSPVDAFPAACDMH